jgi:hypothetical protein
VRLIHLLPGAEISLLVDASVDQKFDLLMKMEPMGGRKPSQQLHAMLGMEAYLLPLPLHAAAVTGSSDAARRNAAR